MYRLSPGTEDGTWKTKRPISHQLFWLMRISTESTLRRQISVHVDKQKRSWSTFSLVVGSGRHIGPICCNVLAPTKVAYPSSWEENRRPIIEIGPQKSKRYELQYGLQSPPVDSTSLYQVNQVNKHSPPTLPDVTHTNHFVLDTVDALQFLRLGC